MTRRNTRSILVLASLALALTACSEPGPAAPLAEADPAAKDQSAAGLFGHWLGRFGKSRRSTAAVYWNGVAREFVDQNASPPPFAIRGFTIVGVAQYKAAVAALRGKARDDHPSLRAAIAAASVATLSYLYPAQATELEGLLEEFLAAAGKPGEKHKDVEAGLEIGRTVGDEVVAYAQTDRFFATGTVEVPTGPCLWFSATPPGGALFGQAKTFVLKSSDQFRPPPPPACDSDQFATALAEVRQISDTRTPEQVASAAFWESLGGITPPGIWNEEAAKLIAEYRLDDLRAAAVFAAIHIVAYDGIVASHEAKYHYWLIRPSQVDPGITIPVILPNFPSYPSNHATISAAMGRMLGYIFPAERRRLDAWAEEAAFSRVLGGIHYRFDGEAGLELGRKIAAFTLVEVLRNHGTITLQ